MQVRRLEGRSRRKRRSDGGLLPGRHRVTVIEYGSYARTSYVPVAGGVLLVCATVAFFLVRAAAIFLVLEILV